MRRSDRARATSAREELEQLARILGLAYVAERRLCFCKRLLLLDEEPESSDRTAERDLTDAV